MQRDSFNLPGLWATRSFEHVAPPITVLIVDDDDAGARALSAALAIEGFRTAAATGGYAVRIHLGWTPHVVNLDLEMLECDGFAVAEAMRGSGRFARVPIIAHTSLEEVDVIERGVAVQIDAFCRKGSSLSSLLRLIAHMTPAPAPRM
jgi:CheY-like chemotaxis protein